MKRTIPTFGLCALLAYALAAPLAAESPAPFPEFTFKRVKVPKTQTGPRITVQIAPQEEEVVVAASSTSQPDARVSDSFAWFWSEISPTLSAAGPGRLEQAIRHMVNGPAVASPRLEQLRGVIEAHNSDILLSTIGTKVSPALVLSVISVESSGRNDAVSPVGATGLMQLMPDTAARFGVTDALDPAQNIKGGVAYLDWLMGEFGGDPILVLAAYNAGEGSIRKFEGVPPYDETRAYVPKVLAAWSVARALCKTPPELISDGCAFNL